MLSSKVSVVLMLLNVQAVASVMELASDEIDEFTRTLDTRVIYFETKDSQTKYPLFIEEYAQSAQGLDSYGVQLGKVNCSTENHKYCSEPSEASVFVFRDQKLVKSFPIKKLKNEHTLVANILHRILLKDELIVVQTEDDFKKILEDSRGKQNVILTNVKEIGMKDHRYLLEVAFAYGDSFKFYLTTKLSKGMYGADSKLKAFLCKEKDCEVRHYESEFRVVSLATFIQSLTLPQAVILGEDKTIPYTDKELVTIPIDRVYLFVKDLKDPEGYRAQLEKIAKTVRSSVGFIVVEVEKHEKYVKHFGLADDSPFPALAFIPGHKSADNEEEELAYADVFTSDNIPLKTEDLADFVHELIVQPSAVFGALTESRSLAVRSPAEYVPLLNDLDTDYLLVAFCKPSVELCPGFSYDYQRLSRTYDRHFQRSSAPQRNIKFSIIFSERDMDPGFEIDSYPTVRLHKRGEPVTKFIPFTGHPIYLDLIDFLDIEIGLGDVYLLPASGLDNIELDSYLAESDERIRGDDGKVGFRETEASEDDDDVEERPPEETEDDEVAAAGYEIYYTKAVNDSHIPKLNDTSFNTTVKRHDISVVFFFLPWDARSQAFSPSYAAAAKKIVEPDGTGTDIGVQQVNCFDWEDVCAKENVKLYPTLRFYRKKQPPMDYRGVLDESSLVNAVKLLQASSPIKLTSDGEAVGFQLGKYPMTSILYTDVSVFGLFSIATSNYVSSFQSAARAMEGQFLFGYTTGKIASDMAARLDVSVPSIVLVKRNDPLESKVVFEGEYTEEAIAEFVKYSSLPKYGELTPLNFPTYFSKGQPFLIAFISEESEEINSLVSDFAKSDETHEVNFCWGNISEKVNRDILEAYTRDVKERSSSDVTSAIVLVNHRKGTTYVYKGELQKEKLVSWMKACLLGSEDFTGKLETNEWKPRLEGYDFLAKIKEDAEDKEGEDGKSSDPWEDNEESSDNQDEDDEDVQENRSPFSDPSEDQSTRFHAEFHAKKQSRLDQRRRIVQKPVHEVHTEL